MRYLNIALVVMIVAAYINHRVPQRTIYFGDSITAADTSIPISDNKGIWGNNTDQMLARFQRDVIEQHPYRVIILAGINDIGGSGSRINTEQNIQQMVQVANSAGIHVTLCTLLATSHDVSVGRSRYTPKDLQRVRDINTFILGVPHTQKFDYYSLTAGRDGFAKTGMLYDGLHPNYRGYAAMHSLWENN